MIFGAKFRHQVVKHNLHYLKKHVTDLNEISVHFYAFDGEEFVSAFSLIDF